MMQAIMVKYFTVLVGLFCFWACGAGETTRGAVPYVVRGTVKNLNADSISLFEYYGNEVGALKTVALVQGQFEIRGGV
ncbi:MAG: hypothetical protein RMM53_00700, partial [Bacteroidia bacterium]|nr:DUF4369 domain-containing protein [Bacteroidia bacterium]MDW8332714.1 hypothetical protein [Bacteroidia bacterium]